MNARAYSGILEMDIVQNGTYGTYGFFFPQIVCLVICLFVFVMLVAAWELIPRYSQSLAEDCERIPFTLADDGFNWELR